MHGSGSGEFRLHWRALAGCTIAASIGTIGFHAYTSGAFLPALIEDAGYTKAQLSVATLVLSASVAVMAPIAGSLMDRYGALRVISVAIFGEAFAFAMLGIVPSEFPFYLATIALLAVLGVGTTPPGFARLVTARFDKARGFALGIMISGLGIMAITAPMWATWLISQFGWRTTYLIMAGLVLLLGGAGALLIRSDGPDPSADWRDAEVPSARSAAPLRKPLFWIMLIGFLAPALFSGGYLLHLISLLRERGFTPQGAAQVQSMIGVAVLIGRLSSGAALDRFSAPLVAAFAFTLSAIGCLALLLSSPLLLGAAAFGIGLTIGAELDIMAYFISRYFGLKHFGRLYGIAYGCLIISAGASPVLIAFLSGEGGYELALVVSAIGTFAGALILLKLPDPRNSAEPAGAGDRPEVPASANA